MCPHLQYVPAYIRVIIINNQFSPSSLCTASLWKPVPERDILVFSKTTRERLTKCYGFLVSQSSMGTISFHCREKSNGIGLQIIACFPAISLVGKAGCWKISLSCKDLTGTTQIWVVMQTARRDDAPAGAIVPLCPKITIKASIKCPRGT